MTKKRARDTRSKRETEKIATNLIILNHFLGKGKEKICCTMVVQMPHHHSAQRLVRWHKQVRCRHQFVVRTNEREKENRLFLYLYTFHKCILQWMVGKRKISNKMRHKEIVWRSISLVVVSSFLSHPTTISPSFSCFNVSYTFFIIIIHYYYDYMNQKRSLHSISFVMVAYDSFTLCYDGNCSTSIRKKHSTTTFYVTIIKKFDYNAFMCLPLQQ